MLDRLLEDERLEIEGISGTSAGAVNAVVLADGLVAGGEDRAREALRGFWKTISDWGQHSPVQRTLLDRFFGNWSFDLSPGYLMLDVMSRFDSPYDFNRLNLNPFRDLIAERVDFERVRSCNKISIFISATNVHTGKIRVFETPKRTADTVMASACLPFLYQAVEIDGVPYWDGGFMGNPALFPLFKTPRAGDILIVQVNPARRAETPVTAREILNRMNEISFNSSLLREMRAVDFVARLIDDGKLDAGEYRRLYMHRIDGDANVGQLSASSKFNTEWAFLELLYENGRVAAEAWLGEHFEALGNHSTLDLASEIA